MSAKKYFTAQERLEATRLIRRRASKKYKAANKVKIAAYNKEWQSANRAINRIKEKNKMNSNPKLRILRSLRTRLVGATKGICFSESTKGLLGCSMEQFHFHLESLFKPGMSFENYGKWHVDHKIPCANFDLTYPDQRAKCFHYSNLQPLWAMDNFIKNRRVA